MLFEPRHGREQGKLSIESLFHVYFLFFKLNTCDQMKRHILFSIFSVIFQFGRQAKLENGRILFFG